MHCLGVTKETAKEVKKPCYHAAGQKCVNCLDVDEDNFGDVEYECKHPPSEKCPNCFKDESVIKDAKHQSFENFVAEIKKKCKGKHQEE